ncbi:hypothetical protein D3C86_1443520 [compost metagenome]
MQVRCDIQTAGATDHQQALDPGLLDRRIDGLGAPDKQLADFRLTPARVEGVDQRIVARQRLGQGGGVIGVAGHGCQRRMRRQFFRVTDDAGDPMATVQGFLQDGCANEAAGADQGEFHGCLPVAFVGTDNRSWIKVGKIG